MDRDKYDFMYEDADRNTPTRESDDGSRRPDTPGPIPEYQYSREKLIELGSHPTAKERPTCLSPDHFNIDGLWDPERWFRAFDGSRGNSPLNLGEFKERKRNLEIEREFPLRRASLSDPKERLKEERDGIVLSPQRRSFGTGCHVSQSVGRQLSCPSEFQEVPERDRDRRDPRRIGSGRIQIDRDNREQPRERDRDFRAIRDRYDSRDERDRRYERDRGFSSSSSRGGREFPDRNQRDFRGYSNHDRRNRPYHREESEPEWFTSGPTSRSDQIELRGFEKPAEEDRYDEEEEEEEEGQYDEVLVEEGVKAEASVDESQERRESVSVADRNGSLETNESSSPDESNHSDIRQASPQPPSSLFDFNEFFKLENIPGLNDEPIVEPEVTSTGSRFTRWFRFPSSQGNSRENSRRSSINEEFGYLNDLLNGSRSPVIPSPPPPSANSVFDRSHFFTPAGYCEKSESGDSQKPSINPLLSALFLNNTATLERSNTSGHSSFSAKDAEAQLKAMLFGKGDSTPSSGTASPGMSSPLNLGRAKTVAELEADIRPQPRGVPTQVTHPYRHPTPPSQQPPPPGPQLQHTPQIQARPPAQEQQQDEGDLTAFNKLLSLMQAGAAAATEPPKIPIARQEPQRTVSPVPAPPLSSAQIHAQNEFFQALQRNKEQQLQLRQQALHQMRLQHQISQPPPPMQPPQPPPPQMFPQQHLAPVATTQPPPQVSQADPVLNFIKQNPTIITKAASPTPPPEPQPPPPVSMNLLHNTSTPRAPSPSVQMMQHLQQQPPPSPRVPSPIMFSQQPPLHLSAPSPIHPTQLVPPASPGPTGNTLSTPPIPRVPSPQELIAHTQAIMQNALIKKQLEDQKERFIKKQHDSFPGRAKSPNPLTGMTPQMPQMPQTIQPVKVSMPVPMSNTNTVPQNKPAVPVAFTPTSVMRKMHSEKASEREKQQTEHMGTDSGSPEHKRPPPIKQLVKPDGSENMDDNRNPVSVQSSIFSQAVSSYTPSNTTSQPSFSIANQNVSTAASMNTPEQLNMFSQISGGSSQINQMSVMNEMPKHVRALIGQGSMQPNIPIQVQTLQGQMPTMTTPIATGPGRPIIKGVPVTSTPNPGRPVPMTAGPPPNMGTPQVSKADYHQQQRAIIGTGTPGMDMARLIHQQQQRQLATSPNPLARSVGVTSVTPSAQFGIPITGRMPMQSNMNVLPPNAAANAVMMQQLLQGGISPTAARVSAMNQLNQINQLSALQAQQRMLDPRMQGIRNVYPPPMLSPRSAVNTPTSAGMGVMTNANLNTANITRPQVMGHRPNMNGPISPGINTQPVVTSAGLMLNGNNNFPKQDANLLRWFGNDVLKTQLPSMPPLPAQGQKVMTVDEIERCQQMVSN